MNIQDLAFQLGEATIAAPDTALVIRDLELGARAFNALAPVASQLGVKLTVKSVLRRERLFATTERARLDVEGKPAALATFVIAASRIG